MAPFTLETADGGQARQFEFNAPSVSIGRDRTADFTLDHPTVSRQHAVISWDGRQHRLIVLSRGGFTGLDGQQVGGEIPLFDGSVLMFGQLQFLFRSPYAPPRPANAPPYGAPQQGAHNPYYGQAASVAGMHATASGLYQAPGLMPSSNTTQSIQTMRASGSFPSLAEHQQLVAKPRESADGLVSWDEIAATADQVPEERDAVLDFQRMQKAQAEADAAQRGINPMLIIGLIIAVGFLAVAFLYGGPGPSGPGKGKGTGPDPTDSTEPIIALRPADYDCIGVASCRASAVEAFNVGKVMLERSEADIINLYEGFRQLERAQAMLDKVAITPPPPEMKGMDVMLANASEAMKKRYLIHRANFFASRDRNDHAKMAEELRRLQAYFPDERLNYNRWAQKQILEMKSQGVYPSQPSY